MTDQIEAVESEAVEKEVRIAARPETVFGYFTEPDKMVKWQGKQATLDPRPGGVYRLDINGENIARGEYVEVVPYSKEYSEQGQRGVFWRLLGEFRGNTPASRAVFPDVPPSHCAPAGPLQPLTGPSGGPRPDLAHCAHVSQSVGPPPSAGCPSQKAAPDAPCSSPVPGSAPWRSQTPASLSGKGAPPWP